MISSLREAMLTRSFWGVNLPTSSKNTPDFVVRTISLPSGDHCQLAPVMSPSVTRDGSLVNPKGKEAVSVTHKPPVSGFSRSIGTA